MGVDIIAILSVFSFLAFLTYMFFSSRNKERMALIESGRDASIFKPSPESFTVLKWGLLILFLGIGLAIGIFIDVSNDNDGPLATLPLTFIFGGLGLIIYYRVIKSREEEEED